MQDLLDRVATAKEAAIGRNRREMHKRKRMVEALTIRLMLPVDKRNNRAPSMVLPRASGVTTTATAIMLLEARRTRARAEWVRTSRSACP